jgi:hypothetical protein
MFAPTVVSASSVLAQADDDLLMIYDLLAVICRYLPMSRKIWLHSGINDQEQAKRKVTGLFGDCDNKGHV